MKSSRLMLLASYTSASPKVHVFTTLSSLVRVKLIEAMTALCTVCPAALNAPGPVVTLVMTPCNVASAPASAYLKESAGRKLHGEGLGEEAGYLRLEALVHEDRDVERFDLTAIYAFLPDKLVPAPAEEREAHEKRG